jgi:peptidoglycan/xylan/chitin deacetylase (PgdA/CDA1 family)
VAVLNYHFTVNFEAGELELCTPQSICIEDSLLDEHIKYIKDNDFFAMKMEDLELFLDGKINIPKKSVVITFDDGPFMQRAISILEKYDIDATLFLIGVYYNPADYESKNLFLASHTWNLHGVGICSDKEYGGGITCLSEEEIQEDLRKSRESLNNTTYLCLPFYEYNSYSLEQITKAGFTMAFVGGMRKAYPGINKLTVPRYVIYNTTSVDELANIIN